MTNSEAWRNVRAFKDLSLPLAVVVAATHWDEPPRMRHQVTRQLLRWFNVLFVEFLPGEGNGDEAGLFRQAGPRLVVWRPSPSFHTPIRLYANVPAVHGWVNRWYRDEIIRAVSESGATSALLFNFVYHFPEIMESDLFSYKAYFCFDELPRMWRIAHRPNMLKYFYRSRLYQHYENQVAKRATRCFAPHYPLREKIAKINSNVDMLFHATEFEALPLPAFGRRSGHIQVGFAGYIHYRLLDDWLVAIAQQNDMALHLIGPVYRYNLEKFKKYPNVKYVKPLIGRLLTKKLLEMDVLVIPLDPRIPEVQVITTNSKTFQYIATGKPIVISDMPHYIKMPPGVIYRARTAQEFVDKIRQGYHEDCEELVQLRLKIAAQNTWDKRGDMLLSIIKRDMGGRLSTL